MLRLPTRRSLALAVIITLAASGGTVAAEASASSPTAVSTETGSLDSTVVHSIAIDVDETVLAEMIETYRSTQDKEWISATVTIDGVTYDNVGLRLKGNSSLRSVSTDSAPETLPWLIKLDKFVTDQAHEGIEELVIRSNTTTTALNEAVALDLLEAAGLASQDAMATGFSVNGSDAVLRLAIEHPDGEWIDNWMTTDGSLYKAESGGDWSYRGDDAGAYEDVFDLEAGDDDALNELTAFLEFINESDDATFVAELPDRLDIDAFARYLAMMDLLGNFDDIDGPGNNAYLYHDPTTGQMTVVPWDMNLAFGVGPGGGMPGGEWRPGDGAGPPVMSLPADVAVPMNTFPRGEGPGSGGPGSGGGPGGMGGRSNVLVERFTEHFGDLVTAASTELQDDLFTSGVAAEMLAEWVAVLADGAIDLVDAATLESEAAAVSAAFPT
jgi:spore coat protein CotH